MGTGLNEINGQNDKRLEKNGISNDESKVTKKRYGVSRRILDIIEGGNKFNEEDSDIIYIEKIIKEYIRSNISNIENGKDISVFQKYFNQDESTSINGEKINSKFEKYFPIHFPYILEKIKKDVALFDKKSITQKTLKDTINAVIRQYSYIIFILGEKIKLGELINYLDIKDIEKCYKEVNEKIQELDKLETEYINKQKDPDNELINEKIFATAYRNILKRTILEGDKVNSEGISKEIEELFKHSFEKLFIVFSKWTDSNGKYGDDLINIEKILKKLIFGINIFEQLNISFNDKNKGNKKDNILTINIKDIYEKFIENIKAKNTTEEELKKLFSKFISRALTNTSDDYGELIDQIYDFKKRIAESKIPEVLKFQENLDLNTVDFDGWKKVPEEQKYQLMFNQIIGKDGKINVSEYLQLENLDYDLVGIFTESYGIDYGIVSEQLMRISDIKNQTIQQFIDNDINNLNLVIIWWRFLLKVRLLKKEGKAISIENIKEIKETPYGVIEKISEKLKELKNKGKFNYDKLNFKPEGKLNNISVENLFEQLKSIIKGIKNGPLDLSKISVIQGGQKILIKELSNLYIPEEKNTQEEIEMQNKLRDIKKRLKTEILEEKERNMIIREKRIIQNEILRSEYKGIVDWLNTGIDLCFNLLKDKKIENCDQLNYLDKLIKLKIIPKNYKQMDIKDYEKIQDLVEALKFIYSKKQKLLRMIAIGNRDKEKLKKELEYPFFLENGENNNKTEDKKDNLSGFGPQKSYTRAFKKLIKTYSGDFTKIGDLTRLRIEKNNLNELIDKLIEFIVLANNNENITHISIIDNIGEPISDAIKDSGYRDIKLLFTFAENKKKKKEAKHKKGGNVVELQFHFNEMLKLKEEGINLYEEINELSKYKYDSIFNKIKREKKRLTDEDITELFKFAKTKNLELPKIEILEKLMLNENIYSLIISEKMPKSIFSREKISATYLYDIRRQLDKDSPLYKKLTRFERVLSDNAWSKAVIEYLKSMGIKINEEKPTS